MTVRLSRAARAVPLFGLLAGIVLLASPPSVSAQRVGQTVATSPRLELVGQEFALQPGGVIHLEYRLTGIVDDALQLAPVTPAAEPATSDPVTSEPAPVDTVPLPPVTPPIALTLEVTNYRPLVAVDDVARVVGSNVSPSAFTGVIDGVAITGLREQATVAEDGSIDFTIEIPTDATTTDPANALAFDRPGIYPLRVQLLVGDTRDNNVVATAGTVVERLPGPTDPTAPPINLSVVTVTPSPPPDATDVQTAEANRALDASIDLAGAIDAPVTLEVPPPLVAAQATTPAGAQRLTTSLVGDELVALPLVPLDVSSAVEAGRGDTFNRLVNAGEDVLTKAVPGTPVLRNVWMTVSALSASGAQQLRDLGTRFVVMQPALYRTSVSATPPPTDLFVDAALPDGGTLPILVVDPAGIDLTHAAADASLAEATPTEWSVTAAARLLLDRDQADGVDPGPPARRSMILTTPDFSAPDSRLLGALEKLVATTPSMRFVAASTLIGVTDSQTTAGSPTTVRLPETAGPSLVARVELLDTTALAMVSAASMLPDDDPRPATWSSELDSLISTAYSDAEVEAATAELLAEADAIKAAVELPDPFTFTLTGRSGTIEIRIGNTSSEPLEVSVQLDSAKVEFPEGTQSVSLRPADETSLVVPVEARSNGTSTITLTVSTPAGEVLGEPVTITSRVTGFTGLGQLLTGGFILVLLTWWFSHWRARRKATIVDDGRDRHPTGRKVGSDAL
jgi:hypothetical protein